MITQKLWQTYLPGEPPPNCTYQMFVAAREFVWKEEDREEAAERLQDLRVAWKETNNQRFKELIELEARQIKEGI